MKVVSWNVKGLRTPNKRMQVLRHLKRLRPDVAMIQETHLREGELALMKKLWVGSVFGSASRGNKAGVITLVHKQLAHSLVSHECDEEGRMSHLVIDHSGERWHIYNVYGPNSDNKDFFRNLGTLVGQTRSDFTLVGGDFNTVQHPSEDRKSDAQSGGGTSHRVTDTVLTPFLRDTGICDAWRDAHPDSREYTHYSHAHQSWSRIDCLLLSEKLYRRMQSAEVEPMVISDHSPVTVTLWDSLPRGTDFLWRFPAHLSRTEDFRARLKVWWLEFISDNGGHSNDPSLLWATAKAVLRGRIMAYVSSYKKAVATAYNRTSNALRKAYTTFKNHPTLEHKTQWTSAKREFDVEAERKEALYRSAFEADLFHFGNKSGKLLARLAGGRPSTQHIAALKDDLGNVSNDPKKVNSILRSYYASLYDDTPNPDDAAKGIAFLDGISLPRATQAQRAALNADVTEEEVSRTIGGLATGKAPGPDGFTAEFFKSLKEQVSPVMTQCFNEILQRGILRPESKNAYIKVLPKPGKDPLLPSSYRPISLIDVDQKMLSKIVADRLAAILPHLIGASQVGFVKGRAAVGNIRKVLAALDKVNTDPHSGEHPVLLALDAEKAFDNVKWSWLDQVLDRMEITGAFRMLLRGIYTAPTAQICTLGYLSTLIPLRRGTRQGCPLSPLLFDIAIEPLARHLEDTNLFRGIQIHTNVIKLAMFADDVILFLSDPVAHIPEIFHLLQHYGSFSGYKVNVSKSEVLEIGRPVSESDWQALGVPIHKAHNHITYLGIKIGKSPDSLYTLNYPPPPPHC